jgi:hypothetical protein
VIPKIFLLAALSSSIFGWAQYRQQGMEVRKNAAASWDSEDASFVATGIDNETLTVILPDADPVYCDAYVDSIAVDKDMRWEIKARGFTTLKCLDRVLILR